MKTKHKAVMEKINVQSLNKCFNVSGEDFILVDDDYEILSSPPPFPEEVKKAISVALMGNKNGRGNRGKTKTEEEKQKIRSIVKKLWESGAYKDRTNGHKKEKIILGMEETTVKKLYSNNNL